MMVDADKQTSIKTLGPANIWVSIFQPYIDISGTMR